MYLRLAAISAIFNLKIAMTLLLPFVGFALAGGVISAVYALQRTSAGSDVEVVDTNPLELRTAFVFAALFMAMTALTQVVMEHFGTGGLHILSFVVGFTDIDPFVLSVLTGQYTVEARAIAAAVMIAAGSNNLLKALYAIWFGGTAAGRNAALWLIVLGLGSIGCAFII